MNSQTKTTETLHPAELAASCERMVFKLAMKAAAASPDPSRFLEELVEIGRDKVLRIAQEYDPARGIRFGTFAYRVLSNAMSDYVQRAPRRAFLEAEAARRRPRPRADVGLQIDLADAIDAIPNKWRETFDVWVACGLNAEDVAQQLGITRAGVSCRLHQIHKLLREHLADYAEELLHLPRRRGWSETRAADTQAVRRVRVRRRRKKLAA